MKTALWIAVGIISFVAGNLATIFGPHDLATHMPSLPYLVASLVLRAVGLGFIFYPIVRIIRARNRKGT